MDEHEDHCCARVACNFVLEGGEVGVLKGRQDLVVGGDVNVTKIFVLLPLFRVLLDELLLAKGGCPCRNVVRSTRVGWADKRYLDDKHILRCRQDKPKVAVLAPYLGTLDRCYVHGD